MAYLGMDDPTVYKNAVRSALAWWVTVDATYQGLPVAGAQGMRPTGGTITDTTKPNTSRRTLNELQLAPVPGQPARDLFEALAPIGTTLTVTGHVRFTDYTVVDIPMGVFDVDTQKISEGDGGVTLTAPDKWVRIQRARFVGPASSDPNITVVQQIVDLIRGALGASEPVNISASSEVGMSALVWEKDRDKAITDLAAQVGAWVYFDREGVATVTDQPTAAGDADWLVDASASGVLVTLDRERSRANARNVVVVSSSATDGERFPVQYVWDDDPTSATYAGTDPKNAPGTAGPFGISTYYFDSPILTNELQARTAGLTILARTTGLASQVSLDMAPNMAVDAFDAIDVLTPGTPKLTVVGFTGGGGFGTGPFGTVPFGVSSGTGQPIVQTTTEGAVLERHVVDTIQHPLTVGPGQLTQIDGRSTRTDDITGGS